MWYLELLVYVTSILAVSSSILPWSIMVQEYTIEPDCKLMEGFQFKLWGTACGHSWSYLQSVSQTNYFAYVNVVPTTKLMTLVVGVLSGCLFLYVILKGTTRAVLLMTGLIIAGMSLFTVSNYVNKMQTTMTLPPEYLIIQGPGYLALMLSAAVAGSIFFTEVFIGYYKMGYCSDPTGSCSTCEVLTYIVSLLVMGAAFGDLALFGKCPDYVSPIDMVTCPACDSPLVGVVTVLGTMSFVFAVSLHILVKFFYDYWRTVNALAVSVVACLAAVAGVTYNLPSFKTAGSGMYSLFVGIVLVVVFLGVYNNWLNSKPVKPLR